ncbi:hypothetical protein EVAR_91560_1 [Eumeta japonica]|uniref:Uncharacterized protein n=1 Tax=Eumeta variegata TaxID=151549 RepID=A0A4C1XD39_EUMVA|nr:hypothetical protein EVAR_91560_1 [Eumeta japonica]
MFSASVLQIKTIKIASLKITRPLNGVADGCPKGNDEPRHWTKGCARVGNTTLMAGLAARTKRDFRFDVLPNAGLGADYVSVGD